MSLVDRELKYRGTNQSSGQTWEVWKEDERHLAVRRHSDGLELQAVYEDARWQPVKEPPLSTRDVQALEEFARGLERRLREREIEQKEEQERQKKKQRQLEL